MDDIDKTYGRLLLEHIKNLNQNIEDYNVLILHIMVMKEEDNEIGMLNLIKNIISMYPSRYNSYTISMSNKRKLSLMDAKYLVDALRELNIIIRQDGSHYINIITDYIDYVNMNDIIYMCEHNINVNTFMRKMKIRQLKATV